MAYGNEDDLLIVYEKKFGVIDHLNRILEGNDLQMIDQVIWLVANTCGESLKLRNLMLTETYIVKALMRIIQDAQQAGAAMRKGLLKNIIWCVCNISRSKPESYANQNVGVN